MVNITELEEVVSEVEIEHDATLNVELCKTFVERLAEKFEGLTAEYKRRNKGWFMEIVGNTLDGLEVRKNDRRKLYMSIAGKYFGRHGREKSAVNTQKDSHPNVLAKKPFSTACLQKYFVLNPH